MAEADGEAAALQFTPTWIVAAVCSIIVLISVAAERGLHHLGKTLKKNHQRPLYEALLKVKEELMLLGFISLLMTVFQIEDDPENMHPSQLDRLHAAVPEAGGSAACRGRRHEAAFYGRRDLRWDQQGAGAQRGQGWGRGRALPVGGKSSTAVRRSLASAAHFHICSGCGPCFLQCYNYASGRCKDTQMETVGGGNSEKQ